jgi:hypothetical protein
MLSTRSLLSESVKTDLYLLFNIRSEHLPLFKENKKSDKKNKVNK